MSTTPSSFRVSVQRMRESHRTTYCVWLERGDRPLDAKPWDHPESVICPYSTEILEQANFDAREWAEFLGATFTPYQPSEKEP